MPKSGGIGTPQFRQCPYSRPVLPVLRVISAPLPPPSFGRKASTAPCVWNGICTGSPAF
ncbi:hypothetical protein CBM2633_B90328 [Cupriavidus taiwanensis]|nr:hypothetical protein CBM2633_B90328 [Cupriavidus taiwanensis]